LYLKGSIMKLLLVLLLGVPSSLVFARCHGGYANHIIKDVFSLSDKELDFEHPTGKSILRSKLGDAVSAICAEKCYSAIFNAALRPECDKLYAKAVNSHLGYLKELTKNNNPNMDKLNKLMASSSVETQTAQTDIAKKPCEYSTDIQVTEFNAVDYAKGTMISCSSTGCMPKKVTMCQARMVCNDHPKYGTDVYNVACVAKEDGTCPDEEACIADPYLNPKSDITLDLLRSKRSTGASGQ
jgi:hypothetical protein